MISIDNVKAQRKVYQSMRGHIIGDHKTCLCPFVQYFRTLFWDDITIIWDENIVYFFN
jgi:hypothetical protein